MAWFYDIHCLDNKRSFSSEDFQLLGQLRHCLKEVRLQTVGGDLENWLVGF